MIIQDLHGNNYSLTKSHLTELDRGMFSFRVRFNDIRKSGGESAQLFSLASGYHRKKHWIGASYYIRVPISGTRIGCKLFTRKTFNKIKKVGGF